MPTHSHYILHKPYGYLSQFVNNQNKRKNKKLLGELYDFPKGTMAIGRLDETSEGLLLLTTDGQVSEDVRSKKVEKVEKEYAVQVDGEIRSEAIQQIKEGLEIVIHGKKYNTLPCTAIKLDPIPDFAPRAKMRAERHGATSWLTVVITEGKFRQVRKMTAAVGFPTLRLIRVRIGGIRLEGMLAGEVVEVGSFDEILAD